MNFPLSHVHPDAKIEKNVTIGPFTTIAENVQIGEGTHIGSNVTILPGARIGRFCQIFPGAVIAAIPQDCKFKGEDTYAYIGDHSTIRECVTISRGTAAGPNTLIGKHVLLMAYVHIAHDCLVEDHCILANAVQVAGHVQLGAHVKIGGTAAIRQFVKIGSYAMVGGGSLVRKDVPPFIKAAREPLQYCGLNVVGLQRSGFTAHQIVAIQHIYQLIFQRSLPLAAALEQVKINTPPCPEKDMIVDFISHAGLGIIKPRLV